MKGILKQICDKKLSRVKEARRALPLDQLKEKLSDIPLEPAGRFRQALTGQSKAGIIAEFKRASPSKGVINDKIEVVSQVKAYELGGAAAVSVVTESDFFKGSEEDLEKAKQAIKIPVLQKDFILDEYQVYQSALIGADAILLILAVFELEHEAKQLAVLAHRLGMDVVLEVHTSNEMEKAVALEFPIIGVNNRDLNTFEVSIQTALDLAPMARPETLLVAESGISNNVEINEMYEAGYRGFLIGETLMRSTDPSKTINEFSELRKTRGNA